MVYFISLYPKVIKDIITEKINDMNDEYILGKFKNNIVNGMHPITADKNTFFKWVIRFRIKPVPIKTQ